MLKMIDEFLNKTTMYRVVLYCLVSLWCYGLFLSFFRLVSFSPISIIFSLAIVGIATIATNALFTNLFKAPSNLESTYITWLILSLILGPEHSLSGYLNLAIVGIIAISSKYIIAIHGKHLFNPAAFGVVVASFVFNYYPSWWVANPYMFWFVLVLGLIIVRKLQRASMVASFFAALFLTSYFPGLLSSQNIFILLKDLIFYSPMAFFAFVMLTEPSTTPPKTKPRVVYGALTAILQAPFAHFGGFYFTPESALLASNIFSWIFSSKERFVLQLVQKVATAKNTYDFVFKANKKIAFEPGQYMEWSLFNRGKDDRGMRRYLTIASSPTEESIRIGIKFYEKPSSFKKALIALNKGEQVIASQLAGEFTLPKDVHKKLVFIAGGIGITPFRSMVKYLLDKNEKRDIILFYSVKTPNDIAYKEIFDEAQKKLDIRVIYEIGIVKKELILHHVPDFAGRIFYISGPKSMVDSFKLTLRKIGVKRRNIKTDFFPGYA